MRDITLLEKATALFPKINEKEVSVSETVSITKSCSGINKSVLPDYRTMILKKKDEVILDFGEHLVGYLSLELKNKGAHADAPILLRIRFAEREVELFEDASTYNGWISASWIQEELVKVDVVPSKLDLARRYSFRYVRIEVEDISSKFDLQIADAKVRAVTSARDEELTHYDKGDSLDQKIDAIAVKTLRDCMQTVFEDGPKRDRRLWIGDLRIQAIANYKTYQMNDMVKSCLYLFGALTQENGRVGACIFLEPEPEVDDTFMYDYSLFFVTILRDYFRETDDLEAVKDLWSVCKRQIVLAREGLDEHYVVKDLNKLGWCFVDWNLELNKQASAQGILLYALEAAIELAECVGDILAEEEFADLFIKVKDGANRFLFDDRLGLYVSGKDRQISYASQIWMILGGAVEGKAAERLLGKLEAYDAAVKMVTPYMYHNYIDALLKLGKKDEAHKLMREYWGGMVEYGADTFWELYNPENPDESPYGGTIVNSYCHAWSCGPAYFLRTFFNLEESEL